mgnify:FL=1
MALNFENSTFGYDSEGLQHLINEINVNCIANTISAMRTGLNAINTSVDQAWVGQSANRFKDSVQEDANIVIDALEQAGEDIVNALKETGGGIIKLDEEMKF